MFNTKHTLLYMYCMYYMYYFIVSFVCDNTNTYTKNTNIKINGDVFVCAFISSSLSLSSLSTSTYNDKVFYSTSKSRNYYQTPISYKLAYANYVNFNSKVNIDTTKRSFINNWIFNKKLQLYSRDPHMIHDVRKEEEETNSKEERAKISNPIIKTHISEDIRSSFPSVTLDQWKKLEQFGDLIQEWNNKINVISRKDIQNIVPNHILPSISLSKILNGDTANSAPLISDSSIHQAKVGNIMDVGCGGGFPSIPLAILYPNINFVPIDSVGKKIKVVEAISKELGLTNVYPIHGRAEEYESILRKSKNKNTEKKEQFLKKNKRRVDRDNGDESTLPHSFDLPQFFDIIVGRSVTSLPKFLSFIGNKFPETKTTMKALGDRNFAVSSGVLYIRGGIESDEVHAVSSSVVKSNTSLKGKAVEEGVILEDYYRIKDLIDRPSIYNDDKCVLFVTADEVRRVTQGTKSEGKKK